MLPNASACCSLITFTLISCTLFYTFALADTVLIDDDDEQYPNLTWDGAWIQYFNHHATDGTLTLGNQSGSTVTFIFTGTSVQVFGALLRSADTTDTGSIYTVDDGSQTEFVPPHEVDENAYGVKFYDSGTLLKGTHTLKIENIGMNLWLDYFQFDDGSDRVTVTSRTTSPIATTITLSSSTTPITSFPSSSRQSGGSEPIVTSTLISESRESSSIGTLSSLLLFTPSTPEVTIPPLSALSSPLPLTFTVSYSFPNISTPSQGATILPAAAHAHGISHSVLVGLTVAAVVGVVVLALLFQLGRARLRDLQMQAQLLHRPIVSDHPLRNLQDSPPTVPDVMHGLSASSWARDVVQSCSNWFNAATRRSRDGGVRIAGGLGVSDAEAPSICGAESEKSTLPPPYEEHLAP